MESQHLTDTLYSLLFDELDNAERIERIGPTIIRVKFPSSPRLAVVVVESVALEDDIDLRNGQP